MLHQDFKPVDVQKLAEDIARGAYAFKNNIKVSTVMLLWTKLCSSIAQSLKKRKGIQLPNLGHFRVGPVIGDRFSRQKQVKPAFLPIEGKFNQIPQERPKYILTSLTGPISQLNYQFLANATALHRTACQKVVFLLLQSISAHILSEAPLQIAFPGVGSLITNKAGRLEFVFDSLFLEHFKQDFKELPDAEPEVDQELSKGLHEVRFQEDPKERDKNHGKRVSVHYSGSLLNLWEKCRKHDRISTGCVPRAEIEGWMHELCRDVLTAIDSVSMLDLLKKHSYGKSAKSVLYRPFLDNLKMVIHQLDDQTSSGSPRTTSSPLRSHLDDKPFEQPAREPITGAVRSYIETPAQKQFLDAPKPAPFPDLTPAPLMHHYNQNELPTQSRAAYDDFNRMHFGSARQSHPQRKISDDITPKVGEVSTPKPACGSAQGSERSTPYIHQSHGGAYPTTAQSYQQQSQQQQWVQGLGANGQVQQQPQRGSSAASRASTAQFGLAAPESAMFATFDAPAVPARRTSFLQAPPPFATDADNLGSFQGFQRSAQNEAWAAPRSRPTSTYPVRQHTPDVLRISHASSISAQYAAQRGAVTTPVLSQYDIMNETDNVVRQRKKAELAACLQKSWEDQINMKEQLQQEADNTRWPYSAAQSHGSPERRSTGGNRA